MSIKMRPGSSGLVIGNEDDVMFHDSIMSDLEAELECELSSFSNSGKLKYNSLPRKPLHGLYSPLPPSQKVAADSVAAAAPAESAKMKAAELIKGQPVKSSVAPKAAPKGGKPTAANRTEQVDQIRINPMVLSGGYMSFGPKGPLKLGGSSAAKSSGAKPAAISSTPVISQHVLLGGYIPFGPKGPLEMMRRTPMTNQIQVLASSCGHSGLGKGLQNLVKSSEVPVPLQYLFSQSGPGQDGLGRLMAATFRQ
jgi:hypothetical protein